MVEIKKFIKFLVKNVYENSLRALATGDSELHSIEASINFMLLQIAVYDILQSRSACYSVFMHVSCVQLNTLLYLMAGLHTPRAPAT